MSKKLKLTLISLISLVGLISLVSFTLAQWAEPEAAPPEGQVPPPLNVGAAPQYKEGYLAIGTKETHLDAALYANFTPYCSDGEGCGDYTTKDSCEDADCTWIEGTGIYGLGGAYGAQFTGGSIPECDFGYDTICGGESYTFDISSGDVSGFSGCDQCNGPEDDGLINGWLADLGQDCAISCHGDHASGLCDHLKNLEEEGYDVDVPSECTISNRTCDYIEPHLHCQGTRTEQDGLYTEVSYIYDYPGIGIYTQGRYGIKAETAGVGVNPGEGIDYGSYAIWARADKGIAGHFEGNVEITGDLDVGGITDINYPLYMVLKEGRQATWDGGTNWLGMGGSSYAALSVVNINELGTSYGLYGQGVTAGVYGRENEGGYSMEGALGMADVDGDKDAGVWGKGYVDSYGGYFESNELGGIGVYGEGHTGVYGSYDSSNWGLLGKAGFGVYGQGTTAGVYGVNNFAWGGLGFKDGYGQETGAYGWSSNYYGVVGLSVSPEWHPAGYFRKEILSETSTAEVIGLYGDARGKYGSYGYGVKGVASTAGAMYNYGVHGRGVNKESLNALRDKNWDFETTANWTYYDSTDNSATAGWWRGGYLDPGTNFNTIIDTLSGTSGSNSDDSDDHFYLIGSKTGEFSTRPNSLANINQSVSITGFHTYRITFSYKIIVAGSKHHLNVYFDGSPEASWVFTASGMPSGTSELNGWIRAHFDFIAAVNNIKFELKADSDASSTEDVALLLDDISLTGISYGVGVAGYNNGAYGQLGTYKQGIDGITYTGVYGTVTKDELKTAAVYGYNPKGGTDDYGVYGRANKGTGVYGQGSTAGGYFVGPDVSSTQATLKLHSPGEVGNWMGLDGNEIASYGDDLHLQYSGATHKVDIGTSLRVAKDVSVGRRSYLYADNNWQLRMGKSSSSCKQFNMGYYTGRDRLEISTGTTGCWETETVHAMSPWEFSKDVKVAGTLYGDRVRAKLTNNAARNPVKGNFGGDSFCENLFGSDWHLCGGKTEISWNIAVGDGASSINGACWGCYGWSVFEADSARNCDNWNNGTVNLLGGVFAVKLDWTGTGYNKWHGADWHVMWGTVKCDTPRPVWCCR